MAGEEGRQAGSVEGRHDCPLVGTVVIAALQKSDALIVTALEEQMSFSFFAGVWWESGHITEPKPAL